MKIGGLEKLTVIDFPGEIAAIVFTNGCNFRCHFCYNPMLVLPKSKAENISSLKEEENQKDHLSEDDLFDFLRERAGKLDGVVVTGGEPTLHADLPEFLKKIRKLGYKIKLDTNGTNPEMVKKILEEKLIDYLAMDLKASARNYERVTGVKVNLEEPKTSVSNGINFTDILKSIKIIMESGIPYEFRTTAVPGLINKENIEEMGELIRGASKWFLQNFKSNTSLVDSQFQSKNSFTGKEMDEMAKIARKYVGICEIR